MSKAKLLPPFELVAEHLKVSEDSPSGLRWKKRPKQSKVIVGSVAGRKSKDGYWQVKIKGKLYLCHRIVYFLITGNDPVRDCIDHPFDRANNIQVRIASHQENSCNRKKNGHYRGKQPSSSFKGVSLIKETGKWRAGIMKNGKSTFLGNFEHEIDAALAYDKAAKELFGDFAYLNDPLNMREA